MLLNKLCAPALIFVFLSLIKIVVDISNKKYEEGLVEFCISILFTLLLQLLCMKGFIIVSWIIVFIPLILYTYMTAIIFFVFGLNPSSRVKHYIVS